MSAAQISVVRKFNPGLLQTDEEIIAQYSVRHVEFRTVLRIVRENLDSRSCQHVLVFAPRGRGKTMLLARLVAECRTNPELSSRALPVRLTEDIFEVFTLAEFWLEVLFCLSRELATENPDLSRDLHRSHIDLKSRWRERELAMRVRASVMDTVARLGRHLVLMVENLQSLTDITDEQFGWGLRQALQTEPDLTLVATATSRFEALDDVKHAFYELFYLIYLPPLDTKSCRHLWQVVGGRERSEMEIEPIRILTGGSPRLLVIAANFAQHMSLNHLLDELVTLIDDHTEYFRSHLEGMPKLERRVYLALVDLWHPSTAGEIAERASLDIRMVSTMLGRLIKRGATLVNNTDRKRYYSAAEGLYSIYYKLRRERGEALVVRDLIRFMGIVFTDAEQQKIFAIADEKKVVRRGLSWARMKAHVIREDRASVRNVYRSIWAEYDADDQADLEEFLSMTVEMLALDTLEAEMLEVLDGDRAKGERFGPLKVALRRRVGVAVREPPEIIAVADRIDTMIEERRIQLRVTKARDVEPR